MNAPYHAYYESPIGLVEIGGTATHIVSLYFVEHRRTDFDRHPTVLEAARQVAEYFSGQRQVFELDLALHGTAFQKQVWQRLLKVPYGQTATYQDIANALDKPKAVRAVGAANGQNPVSIIVPCHRIIGSGGKLVGYGGGLWRKEWLLRHEGYLLV